jgi:uncharacterized protein YqjF (DUF2071 family)
MDKTGLAADYHRMTELAINVARRLGYTPRYWMRMVRERGAVEATIRIVRKWSGRRDFGRLEEIGRVDLSAEYAVLDPRWDGLFPDDVRRIAWKRVAGHLRREAKRELAAA